MSEGFHVKISMFWRRNSTSSLSYFLFKLEPTLTCLEESLGTRSTFLVSWADLNDGSWSETCFFVVCISSGFTMHGHGDHTIRTRNLQLVVDVAWPCMKLLVVGLPNITWYELLKSTTSKLIISSR